MRKKTKKVPKVTKEILKLAKDMEETLEKVTGLGLAATQVGSPFRLCIAKFNGRTNIMINAEITWKSSETDTAEEGCLSLPGINVKVARPSEIIVRFQNEKGELQELKLLAIDSRIVQHEVDHLNGVLITDYAAVPIKADS